MGNGIPGPPNQYPAGLDFDYSVWTAGTQIQLVNVNWNNDYRDVVKFPNKEALNTYIDQRASSGITIDNLTYVKPGQDIFIGIPYNRANRYNYLRASNPLMPIADDMQKDFYYFILECEMVNPGTTRLRLQLDVWQTFVYDVQFGNCYVERGHIGIANVNNFNNYGRDYLTVPEGLDIGSEYQQITRKSETLIMNAAMGTEDSAGDILVVSSTDLLNSGGTADDPTLKSATGSIINGLPSGADFYAFTDPLNFKIFLDALSETPWITQGIISITLVPSLNRYTLVTAPPEDGHKIEQLFTIPIKHTMFTNWRNSAEINNAIPDRYKILNKLKTFPYMVIEMTTWTGNPAVLKPESWNDPDARVMERASFVPPNQRAEFYPRGYNAKTGAPIDNLWDLTDAFISGITDPAMRDALTDSGDDSGEYLDTIVQIGNFPSLPVINNMALGYLAANKNSIAYQYQSADWSQQRAMAGAQAQYDVETGAINTNFNASGIQAGANAANMANTNRTIAAQAAVNAASQAAQGIGNALTPSGFGGQAITGIVQGVNTGVNAGIQTAANDASLGITQNKLLQDTQNQNRQGILSRDTNVGLARFAARGDYANTIAGINAKVRDAALIQPSVSGQFAGESLNIETNKLEMSIRWKMIDAANMRIVGEYWLRFGYAIRDFINIPQSLMVMSKFTYWKLTQTYITASNVPEGHKQVIRGILEKGVTVWANPDEIGVIDMADNLPLAGVSY